MDRVPFDPIEVENAVEIPGRLGRITKKYQTPITPRENYRLLYNRETPLWIPVSGDTKSISPRIDPDNIARVFAFEANPLTPEETEKIAQDGYEDKHGVTWIYIPQVSGSMVRPGNPTLDDVNNWKEKVKFPDIDSWDWEGTKTANAEYTDTDSWMVATILTGFFERLIALMDFENAALALIDDDQKDAVHELFDALAEMYTKMIDKYIWAYNINSVSFHDDWGSQRSPFFSLDTVREMIVPHLKKVTDFCHSRGVYLDMHSCGKNEMLTPAYIEAGCDSWSGQPINDRHYIWNNFAGQLILPMDTEPTFTGEPVDAEEAKAIAKRFVDKYGPEYASKPVLASAGTAAPPEYIDALYSESRKAFSP